jgi:2-phospho-L-lactate guanylyltransferase
MSHWTVVPMRGFAAGKSRLAGMLDPRERHALNTMLLERTLAAVSACEGSLARCIVATADDAVLEFARASGAVALQDAPGAGLNASLEAARTFAVLRGAWSLLVLAADLPDVTGEALRALRVAVPERGFALIADKHATGTNGLLLPADCPLEFSFGEASLARHLATIRALGAEPVMWTGEPALALDLDTPADLVAWQRAQASAGLPRSLHAKRN